MVNDSDGRGNGKGATTRYGMVDMYEFDRETAEFNDARGFYAVKRITGDSLFDEFMLEKHKREFRPVYGNVYLLENVRKSAYMVLVSVR